MTPDRVVVCGLGDSMVEAVPVLGRCYTVGVNDCASWAQTDHVVVMDTPARFRRNAQGEEDKHGGDLSRLNAIANCRPREKFWARRRPGPDQQCAWKLFRTDVETFETLNCAPPNDAGLLTRESLYGGPVPIWHVSPFAAAVLAFRMGAKFIGMIGVDLRSGFSLASSWEEIDQGFGLLADRMHAEGVQLTNLSPISVLQTLTRRHIEDFFVR